MPPLLAPAKQKKSCKINFKTIYENEESKKTKRKLCNDFFFKQEKKPKL
jgi:hypothetical protein